jgi:hypothetical protein
LFRGQFVWSRVRLEQNLFRAQFLKQFLEQTSHANWENMAVEKLGRRTNVGRSITTSIKMIQEIAERTAEL